MDPVSMLIFNALARRQGVNLPGIGALYVVSVPAHMGHGGILTPPSSRVEFAHEEQPECPSIVDLIILTSKKQEDKSWEIYNKWYAEAYTQEQVNIDAVGTLRAGVFTPTPELNKILNPAGIIPRKVQKDISMRQLSIYVALAVVVGVGLSWGAITWLDRSELGYFDEQARFAPPASVQQPAATPQPTAETLTDLPTAAETTPASEVAQTAQTTTLAQTAVSAPVPTPSTPTPSTPAASASSGIRYYVVVGTYSTQANANKFIAAAQKTAATTQFKTLTLSNGKIMIYTGDASTQEQANDLRRQQSAAFPDAWIFKYRAR